MSVVDSSFGHPMKREEKAAMPLAGGVANMGYQCGMLWGAALAAGAQAYRTYGPGPQAEAAGIIASQRLTAGFCSGTKGEINCSEISDLDVQGDFNVQAILKFFLKGGPISCFRMAARYAPIARNQMDTTFSGNSIEAPSPPVSCATVLAEKVGASEIHAVMVSGFAGGIGLSGGACGALGAAIWIIGMKQPVEIEGFSYAGTWINDTIEKFLESTDYEFECSEIVGRKFESICEHADYIREGGCTKIIDNLAAQIKSLQIKAVEV
jgi:hypothetical protein